MMKIERIIPLQFEYLLTQLNLLKQNLSNSHWVECRSNIISFYMEYKAKIECAHNKIANVIRDIMRFDNSVIQLFGMINEKQQSPYFEITTDDLIVLYNKIIVTPYLFSFSQWLMMKSQRTLTLTDPLIKSSLAAIDMKVIDPNIPTDCRYLRPSFFQSSPKAGIDVSRVYQGLLSLITPLTEVQVLAIFNVLYAADASTTPIMLAQGIIDAITTHTESYNLWELAQVHALAPGLLQMVSEYKQLAAQTLGEIEPLMAGVEASTASTTLPSISSLQARQ